jgi:hypothetical protein
MVNSETMLKGISAFSQAEGFKPPESWKHNLAIAEGKKSYDENKKVEITEAVW